MLLTTEEFNALKAAKSEKEWNGVCDKVKAARGGEYPADWFPRVILTGLAGRPFPNA